MSELGSEALWQEIAPLHGGVREAAVGRHGDFEWLGIQTTGEPGSVAQRIARRLIGSGRMAGVVALHPAGREVALAVAFGAGAALTIQLDSPDSVALAALRRLRSVTATGATAFAARAAEILAYQGAGNEFFRQFRATLEALAQSMSSPRRINERDRHTLALVQLTRVLFLYFVQAKGWLDEREDFLARAVDDCLSRRRGLQRRLLEPLFFGILNRPSPERSRSVASFGRIPFLNGGLFEPHPLERTMRPEVPDAAWRDAFDALFERFHFTVSESGADQGSIAPDMLGKVFEGVMSPADRKATGTFYTPAALVEGIMAAALAAAVAARRGCDDTEAAALLGRGDCSALRDAVSLTVLDPACGSGAFLLGALDSIALCRVRLGTTLTAARRETLRHNLFGVDSDAIAVRLAELRLWLAVIADDPTRLPHEPEPLPNLGCLIRQGDSLFAPIAGSTAGHDDARRAHTLRIRLTSAAGDEKRALARELARHELSIAGRACELEETRLERAAHECIEAARAPDLFGRRVRPAARFRDTLAAIRADLRTTRAARRRLESAAEVPWFHFESAFPDVFAKGGFDVVVGNPPWVRAEQLPATRRTALAARYRWWRAAGARGFAHQPDLSVAFLERAHQLIRPGGAVALLVPAKLLTAGYGNSARAALASGVTIHAAADLTNDAHADFGATVYPMALITTRRRPPANHRIRTALGPSAGFSVAQGNLGAEPWLTDAAGEVSARLRSRFGLFGEQFSCALGVKTGANRVFLDPPDVEPDLLRWAVRGRDVAPFVARPIRRILWTHDECGRPLERLPARARRYFEQHESELRARADHVGGRPWQLFRVPGAMGAHRIIWADLAARLTAVALTMRDAELVPLNTCYVARARSDADAHAGAAWLNSAWIGVLARSGATPASSGYARFRAATIGALPCYPAAGAADLADLGRAATLGTPNQTVVDDLVASLLDLSGTERRALAQLADRSAHRR